MKQISKTGDLRADLIMGKNKLDKMANFMEIKSIKPKLKQSEMAKDLQISTFALQRYRRKKNMLSPYPKPLSSNTNTTKQKNFKQYGA